MPKPTQTELKSATIQMLKDALGELTGSLDLEMGFFDTSSWNKLKILPVWDERTDCDLEFWIENPTDRWRPLLVKVSMPRQGTGG